MIFNEKSDLRANLRINASLLRNGQFKLDLQVGLINENPFRQSLLSTDKLINVCFHLHSICTVDNGAVFREQQRDCKITIFRAFYSTTTFFDKLESGIGFLRLSRNVPNRQAPLLRNKSITHQALVGMQSGRGDFYDSEDEHYTHYTPVYFFYPSKNMQNGCHFY